MKNLKKETLIQIDKLSGMPGAQDVSKVAMGQMPDHETDEAEHDANEEEFMGKVYGNKKQCLGDINEVYATFFESLGALLRQR